MRESLIRGATPAPQAELRPVATSTTQPVTAERWEAFLKLVRETRYAQKVYRQTCDPMTRRHCEALEDQLDSYIGWLAADLAEIAAQVEAEKGGAR